MFAYSLHYKLLAIGFQNESWLTVPSSTDIRMNFPKSSDNTISWGVEPFSTLAHRIRGTSVQIHSKTGRTPTKMEDHIYRPFRNLSIHIKILPASSWIHSSYKCIHISTWTALIVHIKRISFASEFSLEQSSLIPGHSFSGRLHFREIDLSTRNKQKWNCICMWL